MYFDEKRNRYVAEISRHMPDADGVKTRVRKTKTLPKGTSEAQARAIESRMESDLVVKRLLVATVSGWTEYVDGQFADSRSWLHVALRKAKDRSTLYKREHTITAVDMRNLMMRCGGRCELTGVRFRVNSPSERLRTRPMFHSLDRIDSNIGYTPENCRIVCLAANIAMMNWGEQVFSELATGYVFNKYMAGNIGKIFPSEISSL